MLDNLLERYYEKLRSSKKSESTIVAYSNNIKQFLEFIEGKCEYNKLNITIIDEYQSFLSNKYTSANTINQKINAIRSFYKFLVRVGEIGNEGNYAQYLEVVKVPEKEIKFLPLEDAKELLRFVLNDTYDLYYKRNVAILYCAIGAGLRVSEIKNLKVSDINFAEGCITVVSSKGNKSRKVFAEETVITMIEDYLNHRINDCEYVFTTNRGKQFSTTKGITDIFKKYAVKLNIEDLTFHSLRKTFAVIMEKQGLSLAEMMAQLGHSSAETTLRNYWGIENKNIKNKVKKGIL